MDKLRVLIIDDCIRCRKLLTRAVEASGFGEVSQVASNGMIALERLSQIKIDFVLLSVTLPDMDSIEVLRTIKNNFVNIKVVITGEKTDSGSQATRAALAEGALDFINKYNGIETDVSVFETSSALKMIFMNFLVNGNIHGSQAGAAKNPSQDSGKDKPLKGAAKEFKAMPFGKHGPQLILIASSTGGPIALEKVLAGLPDGFTKPIVTVQHMPETFTRYFAQSLSDKCRLNVIEAADGENVTEGKVLIAPGDWHTVVEEGKNNQLVIRNERSELVNGVRPSADVLFKSVAKACLGMKVLVIILTGMGKDGTDGLLELKKNCSCYCITQNEQTCVVYGMPKCAVDAGLSDESVSLDSIASRIMQISGLLSIIEQ